MDKEIQTNQTESRAIHTGMVPSLAVLPPEHEGPLTKRWVPCARSPFIEEGPALSAQELTNILRDEAKRMYLPREGQGKYHVWEHVCANEEAATSLISSLEQRGIPVNSRAVIDANLMHDHLFHLDHRALGFQTKEELSAYFSYNRLLALGAGEGHARTVEKIIFKTLALSAPTTPEEIAMRAADLSGVAAEYKIFRENTGKLYEENRLINRTEPAFSNYVNGTLSYLSLYLWHDLYLDNSNAKPWIDNWHQKALNNCISLFAEVRGGREQIKSHLFVVDQPGVDVESFVASIVRENYGSSDVVTVMVSDAFQREIILDSLKKAKLPGAVFAVPYDKGFVGSGLFDNIHG